MRFESIENDKHQHQEVNFELVACLHLVFDVPTLDTFLGYKPKPVPT